METAFKDKRNSTNLRAMSIYTLGLLRSDVALLLAIQAVADETENKIVRKDAATALGGLKDARSIPVLLNAMKSQTNTQLVANSVWALGEIGNNEVNESIVRILDHFNVAVRVQAVWALAKLKNENTEKILRDVAEVDNNPEVRTAATSAIAWIK